MCRQRSATIGERWVMTEIRPTRARIAALGAGPGGLTWARALQRHGLAVTVYERDTAVDSRNQGGSLDMHADTGQIALAGAGLLDGFLALARPEGRSTRFVSPQGEILMDHQPGEGGWRTVPAVADGHGGEDTTSLNCRG